LLGKLSYSVRNAAQLLYPDHRFEENRFLKAPNGIWTDAEQLRSYIKEFMEPQLNITSPEGWYSVSFNDFRSLPEYNTLRHRFDGSLTHLLQQVYPNHKWHLWRFKRLPRKVWTDRNFLRSMLRSVGKELGITEPSQWYNVDFLSHPVLRRAVSHPSRNSALLLNSAFDDHKWMPWKFSFTTTRIWEDKHIQRQFLDSLLLKLDTLQEIGLTRFYSVTPALVREEGGDMLLKMFTDDMGRVSMIRMLESVYPDHRWEPFKFSSSVPGQSEGHD
jgi:hypothetical protein